MSGPWEKYQDTEPAPAEPAPWTKYVGDADTQMAAVPARNLGPRAKHSFTDTIVNSFAGGANLLGQTLDQISKKIGLPENETSRANAADVNAKAEAWKKEAPEYGLTGSVVSTLPEMAVTAGPMSKIEQGAVKLASKVLPKAGAKAAGVAADTVANAGYSAGKAALDSEDPWQAAKAAAAWSLGLRGGVKVIGAPFRHGAAQVADKNAQFLKDSGYSVTPGMMYPKSWVAGAETVARNTPFVGAAMENAEGRIGREYINRRAQEIIDPLMKVAPGDTVVRPRATPEPTPQTAPPQRQSMLPRATGTEVGPSMVEPIPNRYPEPPSTIHIDNSGNAGLLRDTGPAFDPNLDPGFGMFHSTQASRPPDAANLPANRMDTTIPREPSPNASVGPARRPIPDEILDAPPREAPESPAGAQAAPETLEQQMRLVPHGGKVEGEGLDLALNVKKHIDDSYESVVHHTYATAGDSVSALLHARGDIEGISWLTDSQKAQVLKIINTRMIPRVNGLHPDAIISGREMKNLDAILGEQARKFAETATEKPMSDALYAIQHRLRVATQGTTPEARHVLQLSNESFRQALPLLRATEGAIGTTGVPSSTQLREAMKHYGIEPNAIDNAMVQVAPHAPRSGQAGRRWVGSGLGMAGLVTGGWGGVGGLAATGLAGGAISRGVYSPTGIQIQHALLALPAKVRDKVQAMPFADQLKYLQSYGGQMGARAYDNRN